MIDGQGTPYLELKANISDVVSFASASINANSSSAAIVYGISHRNGDQVFDDFHPVHKSLSDAVMPDASSPDGLPPVTAERNFMSLNAEVKNSGVETLDIKLAVFVQSGSEQVLFGYFKWSPSITITAQG